jgi:glycosyltransferase involved in cell wall biosynthesis
LHKLINLLVKTKFSYPVFQSQTIANKFSLIDGPVIYEPLSINVADKNNKKNLLPPVMKKPEAVIISMVSRIHPAKGQLVFLRRFLQVLKKDRGVFVLIIGDITYPDLRNKLYKRHLLDFISENNLENVLFLGFRENVYQYLAVSDICVFPFAQEEPFGIAVAESLALGIPSFFPFKGGAKEVQSIFQRGQELEIAAIASKIEQIRLNPTKFKQPFFIPAPLRFDNYHSKIISLMKSLNL